MNMKVIENAKVVLERGIILDGVIVIKDGRISAYGKRGEVEIPEGAERIDACGAYVGPGFVDIHVHGGAGYQTSDNPVEAAQHFLSHGETSMLCTPSGTGNKPCETLIQYIKNIREAMKVQGNIRGIYMEGPYYNPNYGAHKHLNTWGNRNIEPDEFKPLVDAGGEDIKVWMVAPERVSEGLIPFLEYAREVNPDVKFAVGHSEAHPTEIRALGKYKPSILTHAMNATGRKGEVANRGIRSVGPDEYCLCEPDMYAELISDSLSIHVPDELQRVILRAKGVDKVVLITDSTAYNNPAPEHYAHVPDINFDDRGKVAGSKLTMDHACRNIMAHTGCGIAEAFMMAATNPARAIGLYDELGSIDVDKRADLVIVDDTFNVKKVILGGEICRFD